jgi:excisionase family DNA binding protein
MTMAQEDTPRVAATQPPDRPDGAAAPKAVRREMIESLKRELIDNTLTVDEVAEILDFDRQTVLRYLRDSTLVGFQLGREWRVPVDELRSYFYRIMEERKEQARRSAVEREVDAKVSRIHAARPKDYPKKIYCPDCGYAMIETFGSEYDDEYGMRYFYTGKCEQPQCGRDHIRWLSADDVAHGEPKNGEDTIMDDIPF